MNDSDYAQMSTETFARMQAMYDYSHHQRIAQQEKDRADRERNRVLFLLGVLLSFAVSGLYIFLRVKHSRKVANERYYSKIKELESVQSDILILRSNEEELYNLIHEKEARMYQLNEELSALRKRHESSVKMDSELQLSLSPIYKALQRKAIHGEKLNDKDWSDVNQLVIDLFPGFYNFVMSELYKLNVNEYHTLLLLRLHISPKPISNMLGYTPQNITRLSKSILEKVFDADGNSWDLSTRIKDMR